MEYLFVSRIAQSYGDEDLAAGWDGCVRFSCLRHGWTLHSAYATVPPYPSFLSAVSLRRDGFLVVNAANFLHVLSAKLEFPSTASTTAGLDASVSLSHLIPRNEANFLLVHAFFY